MFACEHVCQSTGSLPPQIPSALDTSFSREKGIMDHRSEDPGHDDLCPLGLGG